MFRRTISLVAFAVTNLLFYGVGLCIEFLNSLSCKCILNKKKDSRYEVNGREELIARKKQLSNHYRIRYQSENHDNAAVRLCGIAILPDSRIILADYSNQCLTIYKEFKFQFNFSLEHEPRGMTGMTGNKIAVTYAITREIIIIAVHDNNAKVINKLDLHLGKPFNIAYSEDQFAVEVGEGDDGLIAIIHLDGRILRQISNASNFAYFTGNTIRLAFDAKQEKVVISAMSKNLVTCLDFDGKIIWKTTIQSPRGLVFLTDLSSKHDKLLLASKRCSTIYELNLDDGKDTILLSAGEIQDPRYMAYLNNILCIQNGNNAIYIHNL